MNWSSWKILSATLLGMFALTADWEGSETFPSLLAETDYPCILKTWRIKGVFVCMTETGPHACLIVENAYPCGIFEVVRQPLKTHFGVVPPIFDKIRNASLSSSHTGELQFAEAHVYTYIPPFPLQVALPIAVPEGPLFAVNYLSEADGFLWRADWLDSLLSFPGCGIDREVPGWGPYTPRSGFAVQANEVVASYLQGLRAGRVANRPDGHIVLAFYPFEPRTGHYIQPVHPTRRSCFQIGAPVRFAERNNLSREGAYFTIHFGIFETCQGCFVTRLAPARIPGD